MSGNSVNSEWVRQQFRYELLTWPEINEAVAQKKVIVIPTGSIEQHGHHLPLDVDVRLATEVCLGAGALSPETMLVMPPVTYGYCHHVMDFPGTINIRQSTFVNLLIEIGISAAYHGFKRIIFVNGHGSNHPLVGQAGRQINLQTDALCTTLSWWQLVAERWNTEWRRSGPGGSAHACELETAMYLAVYEEGVRKDRVRGAIASYMTDIDAGMDWQTVDLTSGSGPLELVEWTSTYTETGSCGLPDLATKQQGALVLNHAQERLTALAQWFRDRPQPSRQEHHTAKPTFDLPFEF